MDYIKEIQDYSPINTQEKQDKKIIENLIKTYGNHILSRKNEIAHITSSGFIMNASLDKVLLIHHNIRNVWSFSGGHADDDINLLHVALKEAKEETGLKEIRPLTPHIASLDILPVYGHTKNLHYVNSHLHLSVAYLLIANENDTLQICPEENSAVEWFSTAYFTNEHFNEYDVYLYQKLIAFAKNHKTN